MTNKLDTFKEQFSDIIGLCFEIDSRSLHSSIEWIDEQMQELETDEDMDDALSLLTEVLMYVNDLEEEYADPYADTIDEINDLADDLRHEASKN